MANLQQLLADYRTAFKAGDSVTISEILQFAKHDAALSARLLALEEELLAGVPMIDVDVEKLVSKVNPGGALHRVRDALEAWINDHSVGIRASLQFLPFAAAFVFGISMYLLGTGVQPPLAWWLALVAALCIGSIAVVCTSSFWRPYPRIPEVSPIRGSTEAAAEPEGGENGEQRSGGQLVVIRQRRITTVAWGLPIAASIAVVAVFVLQRPFLGDGLLVNDREYLISNGEFSPEETFAVPLRFEVRPDLDGAPTQPVFISARLENTDTDVPIPWALTVVDSKGGLIGTSRAKHGAALVSLANYPADNRDEWLATIQLGHSIGGNVRSPLGWSLYSRGARTTFVEARQPRALLSEDVIRRLELIRDHWELEQEMTNPPLESIEAPISSESDSREP